MKYVRIENVLPENLIMEIQKYIQGEYIYIPSCPGTRKRWGEKSKSRDYLKTRNAEIYNKYYEGKKIVDLAEEYFLSESSIRKIVYYKSK